MTDGRVRRTLALVVCLVVAGQAVAGVGGAWSGNAGPALSADERTETEGDQAVAATSTRTATFESVETDNRGDVVEIVIALRETDTATVTIGSEDVNYVLETTVRDGNDDGTVTIQFNTYTAGTHGDGYTVVSVADEGDEVVSVAERGGFPDLVSVPYNYTLDSGRYALQAWSGSSTDGQPSELASLRLRGDSFDGVDTLVASPDDAFASASDVSEGIQTGAVNRTDAVPRDALLIYEIRIAGVAGVVRSRLDGDTSDATEAFLQETGRDNSTTFAVNVSGGRADFPVDSETVTFLPDPDNDTYYLLSRVGTVSGLEPGQEYETSITVRPLSRAAGARAPRKQTRRHTWRVAAPLSTPTPTPTPSPTATPSLTATPSPTPTAGQTPTQTGGLTPTPAPPDSGTETTGPASTAATTSTSVDEAQAADSRAGTETDASGPGYTAGMALIAILLGTLGATKRR